MENFQVFVKNMVNGSEAWIKLPVSYQECQEIVSTLANEQRSGDRDELYITEVESDVFNLQNVLDNRDDVEDINISLYTFEDLEDEDQQKVIFLVNKRGMSLSEALEHYKEVAFHENKTCKDIAMDLVKKWIWLKADCLVICK